MDGASEHTTHHLIHHPVVRAALVVALLKTFRKQQASDEISGRDVAASQLRFQKWLTIASHRMEKDLLICLFDQVVNVGAIGISAARRRTRQLRANRAVIPRQVAHPCVLCREGIHLQGHCH